MLKDLLPIMDMFTLVNPVYWFRIIDKYSNTIGYR